MAARKAAALVVWMVVEKAVLKVVELVVQLADCWVVLMAAWMVG